MPKYYLEVGEEKFEYSTPQKRQAVVNRLPEMVEYKLSQDIVDSNQYHLEWRTKNRKHVRRYQREYARLQRAKDGKPFMRPKIKRRNARILTLREDGMKGHELASKFGVTEARIWQILRAEKQSQEVGKSD